MRQRLSLRKKAKQPIRLLMRFLWLFLGVCLALSLNVPGGDRGWMPTFSASPAIAAVPASQLVQQGVEAYQVGAYQAAIDRWQAALTIYQQQQDWAKAAIVLENLARAQSQIGQTSQAIQTWQQAIELYRQQNRQQDNRQKIGRALTEQAQLYSRQGQSRQAIALLCGEVRIQQCNPDSALQLARQTGDRLGEAAALGSLGKAYRLRGDSNQAIQFLTAAMQLADQIGSEQYRAAAFSDLGQAHLALAKVNYQRSIAATQAGDTQEAERLRQAGQQQDQRAIGYLNQSLSIAQAAANQLDQMQALLNLLSIYSRTPNAAEQNSMLQQALALLETLPDSQEKVYAAIDLARLLRSATSSPAGSIVSESAFSTAFAVTGCFAADPEVRTLLQQAVDVAQRTGDSRSQSFALGELGHFYECQQNNQQAIALTQQARWVAEQNLQAKDSLYQWEWQSGRILKAQGKPIEAIQMYEKAVATLNDIRSDLLIANRDLQFDFRDTVDPVYRDLIALRLELEQTNDSIESVNLSRNERQDNHQNHSDSRNENISAALKTLDALRLAELQNYFGDDCAVLAAADTSENADSIGANAAIFSSVILNDRTALIVTLPDGSQQLHWIETDRNTLIRSVNQYRISLESFFEPFDVQSAQQLYRWIIAPFETTLAQAQIKTLVFVQDGILRSVPMAALHDGQQFLIQNYAIATTPSLSLTSTRSLERNRLRALAVGLTDAVQIGDQVFPPLNYVSQEIQAIEAALPGSKPLLNQDFTRDRIQQELARATFPILHLSTHGEFGFDPESTFLVTGDRQKLSLPALEALIRNPADRGTVDLLTLTACETAVGDDRAALGLAGIAVQAGVESALASLWFVDDAATAQLAVQFYANLRNPSISKAEALQAAQLALIEAGTPNQEPLHPAFWAAFILIGNWR